MMKIFRIPPESELLFQLALVEREIGEVMQSRRQKVRLVTSFAY
jgi:hypothetical protein